MKAMTESANEDTDLLCSCIERANSPRPRSRIEAILWCVGIAIVAAMSILFVPMDVNCLFAILAAILVPLYFMLCEVVYFRRVSEFSYGLGHLAYGDWGYMKVYFGGRKSYFFRRIMRSPAFILIAGFYYKLRVEDELAAAKLIALACKRDADLKMIEMSSRCGLRQRDREVLIEKFRRDLGVTWIYKLKHRKGLWVTGGLLLFLLFVIRHIMILIDSARLLIKGISN